MKGHAIRQAINSPVQSSIADIMKLCMIELDEKLAPYGCHLILLVHDELIFECPEDRVEEVEPIIREVMTSIVELKVPLAVDISAGKSWAECK